MLKVVMDVAADHGGYVPTREMVARGVPAGRLVTLAHRGGLKRVGYGMYRLPGFPLDVHDELILAVLWTNDRGAISHETALGFYELADVNPVAIDLTIPRAYRIGRCGGDLYRVHHTDLEPNEVTVIDGVRVVTVQRAIHGAIRQGVGTALIEQAITTARGLGWITAEQAQNANTKLQRAVHV